MIEFQLLKVGDAEPVLQYRIPKPAYLLATEEPWITVPIVEVEAPPRHWSDILDVALDANREKVEKKYRQKMTRNYDSVKVENLIKAWEQYLTDTNQEKQ